MATNQFPHFQELVKLFSLGFLPSEIIIEILLRLPVKCIFRFRCACKALKTLLSDPTFVQLHIDRAITANKECLLLRHLSLPRSQTSHELEQTYSLLCKQSTKEFARVEIKKGYYTIVDSCNGVVCLAESSYDGKLPLLDAVLWNPSTQEFKTLPKYFDNRFDVCVVASAFGFVFHPTLNDYQVVRIVNHIDIDSYEVEMYSLHGGYWKPIADADIDCCFHNSMSQAFVNGALHWVVSNGENILDPHYFILSFNTREEKFDEISLPEEGDYTMDEFLLHKSQTSLSLIICKIFESFEIWVLQECGMTRLWLKKHSVLCATAVIMKPLHVLNDNKIVMEIHGNEELVLCDYNFQIVRYLHVFKPVRIVNHVETMISPHQWSNKSKNINLHVSKET